MSPSISVAIATFNGGGYLAQQLDSIHQQTVRPALISISDDGSSDQTLEIIERFSRVSKIEVRVRIGDGGRGVIGNFRRAFDACDTEYIAYCDQDDFWYPDKIASYADALKNNPGAALVFHRSLISDEDLKGMGRHEPNSVASGCYRYPHYPDHIWGYGHQMLFSRSVLKRLELILSMSWGGGLAGVIDSNLDISLLVAAGMIGDIVFIDRDLVKFRRHKNSVSPAAKSSKGVDRYNLFERSALQVTRNLNMVKAINEKLGCLGGVLSDSYRGRLVEMESRYHDRESIYSSERRLERLRSLSRLIFRASYGSRKNNKVSLKRLIVDGLASIA